MNGTAIQKIFSLPQVIENCRQIFASPNRYFTENSRWVPLPKLYDIFFQAQPVYKASQEGRKFFAKVLSF